MSRTATMSISRAVVRNAACVRPQPCSSLAHAQVGLWAFSRLKDESSLLSVGPTRPIGIGRKPLAFCPTVPLRFYSASASESTASHARRSMLYVPGSSEKMIKKSQQSEADCIIFDLEDSVAHHRKGAARELVLHALEAASRPGPELAVRINPPSGDRSLSNDDLDIILPSQQLETIVVPKVEHEDDIFFILEKAQHLRPDHRQLSLVLSVESAASLLRMPKIIEAIESQNKSTGQSKTPHAAVGALLFASEDYCASTGIIRTKERKELLFPRAHMATIAKAYGLQAIDMVCIDFKDVANLQDESLEGRNLGYDGKQAIHPAQVADIQRAYSPSDKDILKAARIKAAYEKSVRENKGAVGLQEGEGIIMIDAPMLKQADAVLAKAHAGNLSIPDVSKEFASE